jgi:hypothetical protein
LKKLIALKILRKTVLWIKGNYCEVNTYTFLLSWDKRPANGGSQNSVPNLPPPEREKKATLQEGGKEGSLRQALANQKRMLPILYTPGTDQWNKTCEEIARLEGLLT